LEALEMNTQQETSHEIGGQGSKDGTVLKSPSTSESSRPPFVTNFVSCRASVDQKTYEVISRGLKKHNITGDWHTYALYILYEEHERCLGLNEKALIAFKLLDREQKKPRFMLKKHATPIEGFTRYLGAPLVTPTFRAKL
jgi:hypothetical protein